MQYEVEIEGRVRTVIVTRTGDGFAVRVDDHARIVDAVRIDAHVLSLLVGELWPTHDTGPADRGTDARRRLGPRTSYEVALSRAGSAQLIVSVGATPFTVTLNGRRRAKDVAGPAGAGPQRIVAPMPGKVIRVLVQAGDAVLARQPLVVVEAMKMENELRAARDGTVAAIHVKEGASVDAGAPLIDIT